MSFLKIISSFDNISINEFCASVTSAQIKNVLSKSVLSEFDFLSLLSDIPNDILEEMAQKASALTRYHFGSSIVLFTPMYISNYCENSCPYCSFSVHHSIVRTHLSISEIKREAQRISSSGIRHILLLTGESPSKVSIDYLEEAISLLRDYFSLIAIEIYPLSESDYSRLILAGCDQLTIYQETYDQIKYEKLHRCGPKAAYRYRLDTPERACRSDIRSVTVGALLGLHDGRSDVFFAALHAAYLQKKYPSVEIGISFPRLRPQAGVFRSDYYINDRQFVQMLTAVRLFLPTIGITLSTRETARFRMSVLPLGITKLSAGVSTSVGGHSGVNSTPQFEIADTRDVATIYEDLLSAGFQPVMHDWNYNLMR